MEQPLKTSSFQLPDGAKVEVVFFRTADGKLHVRTPDQLVARPRPPVPVK